MRIARVTDYSIICVDTAQHRIESNYSDGHLHTVDQLGEGFCELLEVGCARIGGRSCGQIRNKPETDELQGLRSLHLPTLGLQRHVAETLAGVDENL